MIGQGKIKAKGVLAPEGCVDPDLFLSELGRRGVKVYEGAGFEKLIN
jgi:hypothetical protein